MGASWRNRCSQSRSWRLLQWPEREHVEASESKLYITSNKATTPERFTSGSHMRVKAIIAAGLLLAFAFSSARSPTAISPLVVSMSRHWQWVMFQPDTPFNKYIISSPGMAYGGGETFRQEADYAKTHKDLAVGVYLAAGSLEAATPEVEVLGEVVSGMSHLAGVLASRHYPGLKLTIEYHPGMNHNDVIGTTVVRGLRTLYAK
jgi:hypothetical protein